MGYSSQKLNNLYRDVSKRRVGVEKKKERKPSILAMECIEQLIYVYPRHTNVSWYHSLKCIPWQSYNNNLRLVAAKSPTYIHIHPLLLQGQVITNFSYISSPPRR